MPRKPKPPPDTELIRLLRAYTRERPWLSAEERHYLLELMETLPLPTLELFRDYLLKLFATIPPPDIRSTAPPLDPYRRALIGRHRRALRKLR